MAAAFGKFRVDLVNDLDVRSPLHLAIAMDNPVDFKGLGPIDEHGFMMPANSKLPELELVRAEASRGTLAGFLA